VVISETPVLASLYILIIAGSKKPFSTPC